MDDVTRYPFVFFPVGLNLEGRRCIVIGEDREAREKEAALRAARADVVRIAPANATEEVLRDAFFVVATPQDAALAQRLRAAADAHKFLLCTIDQPRFGFVAMQALAEAGPVKIAVSTGGIAPAIGKALRAGFARALDAKFLRFIDCLNAQRNRNRVRQPDGTARRDAMLRAAEGFAVEVTARYPAWFEDELHGLAPAERP